MQRVRVGLAYAALLFVVLPGCPKSNPAPAPVGTSTEVQSRCARWAADNGKSVEGVMRACQLTPAERGIAEDAVREANVTFPEAPHQ